VIFVDSNVPMYLVGAAHPHKADAQRLLERCVADDERLVTDAEVLQEILHRYRAIGRWDDGRRVYDLTRQLFPVVVPVTADVLDRARRLLDADGHIMARDALHAAVVMTEGLEAVCSYDRDFDRVKGIVRREPEAL
jgi:predicted nucleic acid-binding protein